MDLLNRDVTGDPFAFLVVARSDDNTGCLWPGLHGTPPSEMSCLKAPHKLPVLISFHFTNTTLFPHACRM